MNIPFYPNLKSDTHCFQACLKMVLAYFWPNKSFTYQELDRISGHKSNQWTWDSQALVWLLDRGFIIKKISLFDHRKFALQGKEYLASFWNEDTFQKQKKMSDFKTAQYQMKKLVSHPKFRPIRKKPGLADIDNYSKKGFVLIASVNINILDNASGYNNHSVVIIHVSKKNITFHDPGLPPRKARIVSRAKFKKALGEITVIRL